MTWFRVIKKISALWVLTAFFPLLVNAVGPHKSFQEYDYSKGLDTYHNPATLPEGFVQNSLNVLFDAKSPVAKRTGYTVAWTTKTYSYTGLWTYTDSTNTTWQLARSSDQITASNLAGSVVKVATVAVSNLIGEANAFGNAYFVDQTQGVYYWNGSSTSFISASPKGSMITQFHNRLWVAGAAVPNGNQLYGSKYYDASTWTTGLNDTDPVQYSIGLQDNFDNITAEYVYLDTLYLYKHYAIFALYGFGQTTFQISQLTQECGCIDGNTIQTYNGGLKFVSLRGVEDFNGYTCKRISDPVKNFVDPAIQIGGFSQASWVQSNQADWNSGTFNTSDSLNSSIAAPSLVLSTATGSFTDNTTAAFNAGTLSNVTVANNAVSIATNNSGNIDDNSFEGGSGTSFGSHWFSNDSNLRRTVAHVPTNFSCTQSPHDGSNYAGADIAGSFNSATAYLLDANSATLSSTAINLEAVNSCGWTQYTLSANGNQGKRFRIELKTSQGGVDRNVSSTAGLVLGGDITFYAHAANSSGGFSSVNFDDIKNGSDTITTGIFTSQTFDTAVSSTILTATLVAVSSTSNTESIATVLQHSTDGSSWADLTTTIGTAATSNRYLRYLSTFTITSADSAFSTLNSVTVSYNFTRSTGSFKSQIHNAGAINSWGNFAVQQVLNGGAIAYSICSSTSSNMGYPASCVVQTANSQITASTGSYVQWYATFTVTAATQTPTLQSGTVQWFTGSAQIPMSSTVWDNRYWLSLTTNTADTANDAVLVLNSRGAWADFDIHAGAFTQYKNSLYHADSRSTGNIYLDNQGYADNGSAINAFLKTKELTLSGIAADDYLYSVYPSASNTGPCVMSVQYTLDKSTNTYSLGSPMLSEYGTMSAVRLPFPIDSSHMDFGQSVNFTVGTNDSSCDWQFFGIEGLYKARPVQ